MSMSMKHLFDKNKKFIVKTSKLSTYKEECLSVPLLQAQTKTE